MKISSEKIPVFLFGVVFTVFGILLLFNQYWPSSKYGITVDVGSFHWIPGILALISGIWGVWSSINR